jgi:TolB-like protein
MNQKKFTRFAQLIVFGFKIPVVPINIVNPLNSVNTLTRANLINYFLFFILFIFFITGCGPKHYVREKVDPAGIKKVAVMPFENFTADEYAAEKIRRIVITDLLSRGVEVVEPGEITRIIRESKIKSLSSIKTAEVQEIGKASGAYAIMIGSVEYYGISRGVSVIYPEVTANFKLMETSTGKVLCSVRHTSGGADFWTRHFGSEGKSLSEAAGEVVREAMNTFF